MPDQAVVEVICIACTRKVLVPVPPQGSEALVVTLKCECGSTIQYQAAAKSAAIAEINGILGRIPTLLSEFKNARRQGFETGVDAALHDLCKELALEILKEEPAMREQFKEYVKDGIQASLDEGKEEEKKEDDGEVEPPNRG